MGNVANADAIVVSKPCISIMFYDRFISHVYPFLAKWHECATLLSTTVDTRIAYIMFQKPIDLMILMTSCITQAFLALFDLKVCRNDMHASGDTCAQFSHQKYEHAHNPTALATRLESCTMQASDLFASKHKPVGLTHATLMQVTELTLQPSEALGLDSYKHDT